MLIKTRGDPSSELHVTTTGSALMQFVNFCRADRRGSVGGKTTSEIETVTCVYFHSKYQLFFSDPHTTSFH